MSPHLGDTGEPGLEDRPAGAPVDGRVLRSRPGGHVLGRPLRPARRTPVLLTAAPPQHPRVVGTCQEGLAVPLQCHPDAGTLRSLWSEELWPVGHPGPSAEALVAHLRPASPGHQPSGWWRSVGCSWPSEAVPSAPGPAALLGGRPPAAGTWPSWAGPVCSPAQTLPVSAQLTTGTRSVQTVWGWISEQTCL